MPDNNLTEKQELQQVKPLLRRWKRLNFILTHYCCFALISGIFIIGMFLLLAFLPEAYRALRIIVQFSLIAGFSSAFALNLLRRLAFLRQLTTQDIMVLENTLQYEGIPEAEKARKLLIEYKVQKSLDDQNLLRASAKAKDETLLRAAHSADSTPQEQLLRPSQADNHSR